MIPEELPEWLKELPPSAAQRRETFARLGAAMYYAQCVEQQLAILLATTLNPDFLNASPEERDRFFDEELRKTLGRLVEALRQRISVSADTEKRLNRALQRRNWLAHNYFRERALDILTWEGRQRMIVELQETADDLRILDEELTRITESWLERLGIDRRSIRAELDKSMSLSDEGPSG